MSDDPPVLEVGDRLRGVGADLLLRAGRRRVDAPKPRCAPEDTAPAVPAPPDPASPDPMRREDAAADRASLGEALQAARAELARRKGRNLLADYRPYPKQLAFHAAGAGHRERLFMAGNQLGKTWAGAFETAMHLTGRYPDWWPGRRFDGPIRAWAAGVTAESTRDNPQRLLVGPPQMREDWGTGAIPGAALMDCAGARGVADALDTVVVAHAHGGQSVLGFKSYEKGREKWQGETLHLVWFDEEPPLDVYLEGLTRTNATGGITMITFTPLKGMSAVVRMFLQESAGRDQGSAG